MNTSYETGNAFRIGGVTLASIKRFEDQLEIRWNQIKNVPPTLVDASTVAGRVFDVAAYEGNVAAAALAAQERGGAVLLSPGEYSLEGNLTVPVPILSTGGVIKLNGYTLTLSVLPVAQDVRLFDLSNGGSVVMPDRHVVNVLWFGVERNTSEDQQPLLQQIVNAYSNIEFPPGTYWLDAPLVLGSQKYLFARGGSFQWDRSVTIRGSLDRMGGELPLFQCTPDGADNVQTIAIQGFQFRGSNEGGLVYDNLEAATDTGIIGIDPAGVKEGLHIKDCSFHGLKRGIGEYNSGVWYTAAINVTDSRFILCYRGAEAMTTTPMVFRGVGMESCADWIYGNRVIVFGGEFNNASPAPGPYCSVRGRKLVAVYGSWFEGGDRQIAVEEAGLLISEANEMSAAMAPSGGAFKYHHSFVAGCHVVLRGVQGAEFTRIARQVPFTDFDWSGVTMKIEACNFPTYQWGHGNTETPVTHAAYFEDTSRGIVRRGSTQSTQLTGTQTDFQLAPHARRLRWDESTNLTLETMLGGYDGRELTIINAHTSASITLKHASTNGATTGRFSLPGGTDYTIGPREACNLIYDGDDGLWRVVVG